MNPLRILAALALAAAAVAVALVLTGGGTYTVNARLLDAGQVVEGGLVQVAGRKVGEVASITLTDDNLANLELEISDEEWQPLHRGTIARVRTVGLSGVANRYVELEPGPLSAEPIRDGGVLSTSETRPIVDLDVFFNSLDPATRGRLQRIVKNGAGIFAGTEAAANAAFGYLAPALAQSGRLAEELARDRVAVERLVRTGATTAGALADRSPDITAGIAASATTMRAIASERRALADALRKAPPLLGRADGLLGGLRSTLVALRPALRDARPVARPLARVLRRIVPVGRATRPALAETVALLPVLRRALDRAPALADVAVPALRSTATSLAAALPIVDGLTPYIPDLVGGFVNGFGGKQTGYYDANGNYGRISVITSIGPGSGTGVLGDLLDAVLAAFPATTGGYRTGEVARCPGGATGPADDASNPYVPDASLCERTHDLGAE